MKVLVIYDLLTKSGKSTINEHLYSFKRYSDAQCYYLNVAYGMPRYIAKINFDLIVYHFTFFDSNVRFWKSARYKTFLRDGLKTLKGYKVAMPQDEYRCSERMNEFFSNCNIKTVFTLLSESEWQKVYPQDKSGLEHYKAVLTGYIDEVVLEKLKGSYQSRKSRAIDIGYRVYKPPYWLGRQGMIKQQLVERFLNAPVQHNLKLDLSSDYKDILFGDDWYKFLCECRVVLSCEGGASLHDPDGSIKEKVDQYVNEHHRASFEEVEKACFPGMDGNLTYSALSPRHFDACMTRTCQALVEGEYGGVLKPGVHYIEIKKDWSNITDVIRQIEDVEFCEQIADNAYRDIVESDLYTYRNFVQIVLSHVKSVHQHMSINNPDDSRYLKLLELRERFPLIFSPVAFSIAYLKDVVYKCLLKLNLYEDYKRIEAIFKKTMMKNYV